PVLARLVLDARLPPPMMTSARMVETFRICGGVPPPPLVARSPWVPTSKGPRRRVWGRLPVGSAEVRVAELPQPSGMTCLLSLPAQGQPVRVERYLGGRSTDSMDQSMTTASRPWGTPKGAMRLTRQA